MSPKLLSKGNLLIKLLIIIIIRPKAKKTITKVKVNLFLKVRTRSNKKGRIKSGSLNAKSPQQNDRKMNNKFIVKLHDF